MFKIFIFIPFHLFLILDCLYLFLDYTAHFLLQINIYHPFYTYIIGHIRPLSRPNTFYEKKHTYLSF